MTEYRKVYFANKNKSENIVGAFHRWFVDADSEVCALIELKDGKMICIYSHLVTFAGPIIPS